MGSPRWDPDNIHILLQTALEKQKSITAFQSKGNMKLYPSEREKQWPVLNIDKTLVNTGALMLSNVLYIAVMQIVKYS